nr:unnamed protein product [Digitaria exilis]
MAKQGGGGGGGVHSCQDDATTGDRISGLPNDLLHIILLRLDSTPEAARTSILARRWRRVWAAVPELSFRYHGHESRRTAPVCLRVNQALAACSVPTVDRLHIAMPRTSRCSFYLHHATATAIHFDLYGYILRFEQAAGAFTALSTRRIRHGYVDSHELEAWKKSCLCIRSDSLEHLEIFGYTEFHGQLEVNAPKLRFFSPRCRLSDDARIVAPMLSEVRWYGYPYNPMRHHLVGVGRHLRRLDVHTNSPSAAPMKLFDTIDDLNLTINIKKV